MDLLTVRQRLVASNIANAGTPGYKTVDINFEQELRSAVSTLPGIDEVEGLKTKNDGNNVNIDREARLLAENALRFSVASQLLKTQIKYLKNAIEEGRSS
jgi:flagellar basal-body rod protein FlgB